MICVDLGFCLFSLAEDPQCKRNFRLVTGKLTQLIFERKRHWEANLYEVIFDYCTAREKANEHQPLAGARLLQVNTAGRQSGEVVLHTFPITQFAYFELMQREPLFQSEKIILITLKLVFVLTPHNECDTNGSLLNLRRVRLNHPFEPN